MKKKVISLFVTGMLAVSMIAGCGSDNTAADTNTSADTTADASTDAADTTAEETPAATADFDASEYVNVLSREDGSGTRGAFIELFGIEEKDARDYAIVGEMFKHFDLKEINLLTNNPKKIDLLSKFVKVNRSPIIIEPNCHNEHYLQVKKEKMGHLL